MLRAFSRELVMISDFEFRTSLGTSILLCASILRVIQNLNCLCLYLYICPFQNIVTQTLGFSGYFQVVSMHIALNILYFNFSMKFDWA